MVPASVPSLWLTSTPRWLSPPVRDLVERDEEKADADQARGMKDLSLSGEKNGESTHVGCVPKGILSEVENNVHHSLSWDGCSEASARLKFAVTGKNIITTFSVSTEYNELGYHSGSGTSSCLELSAQANYFLPVSQDH
ncbi:unnamed protein product [Urochloa humidicola]